jgi:2',3'-cyclic-nucleotide 2'-phosphodiesterase (5'-nucleotidase family)
LLRPWFESLASGSVLLGVDVGMNSGAWRVRPSAGLAPGAVRSGGCRAGHRQTVAAEGVSLCRVEAVGMVLRVVAFGDVERAFDDPERVGRLAGVIGELRDGETVVCGVGDDTGPGVVSVVSAGLQAVDFFEAVGVDVEVVGNHDFDHGVAALLDVVEASPCRWLCANAWRDGERFGRGAGVEPWTVVERGGHRVGLVGVAHPETAEINPNATGVRFGDPVAAAREGVAAVRERGVDHVVVVSHWGDDRPLARALDVDLVVGGHDHEATVDRVAGTVVCRPGGTGRSLASVELRDGEAVVEHHDVAAGPVDAAVADAVRERMAAAGLWDVVAHVDDPIVCDLWACKRGESRVGNLVTDAYRWHADADVAVHSGGGFRRRPPLAGEVTAFDLVSVVPYRESLVAVEVSGERLRETLAELALDDPPAWHFGHVSGATVVWDDDAGELVDCRVGGDPVADDETYRVATTEFFLAHETLFQPLEPADAVARFGPQYEALVAYARETGVSPTLSGRIERPTLDETALPERDFPYTP